MSQHSEKGTDAGGEGGKDIDLSGIMLFFEMLSACSALMNQH